MIVTAMTLAGDKVTIRNKSISEALGILKEGGVSEDWILGLEARLDEASH